MSHMPSFTGSGSSCSDGGCGSRIIRYTATGSELPGGFVVPLGLTMPNTSYYPAFHSVEDDVNVPWTWSFPAGAKTTTQFEARFTGELTAGAVYMFELTEA